MYRLMYGMLLAVLLMGCVGPAPQVSPEQMLSQVQANAQKQKMEAQLLAQIKDTTLTSYKDYAVGPEDLLEVSFFGQDDLEREVRVNGQGEISLPLVGKVRVAGASPLEIEASLENLYRDGRFIRQPQITVSVKEYRHQRVMVSGAVDKPGSYEVIGPRTLLEMLGKAGGLTDKAGDLVQVIRHQNAYDLTKGKLTAARQPVPPQSEILVIDLRRLLVGGALELNVPIKNGDVIHVPHAQMAYVLGAVKKPTQVPVKSDITATQALALAEGLDPLLASSSFEVLRFDEKGQRISIPVQLAAVRAHTADDPTLKANDIVFVPESGFRRTMYNIKNMMPGFFSVGIPLLF